VERLDFQVPALTCVAPGKPHVQEMPTGKDIESISDSEEWRALQEHVKDINTT